MKNNCHVSRRSFLKRVAVGNAGAFVVPSTVFGASAPSNRINVGAIGCGRISRDHDMPGVMNAGYARIDAVLISTPDHHLNWLEAVRMRKQPITNAEIAHRSCSACLLQHIAMKLPRKLYWDPICERFKNDDEANAMLSREQRYPYNI